MVLGLEKDSATTVDAMAIPLPPWLTREYDYASGIRRTGEVIARNLQRRRELEIEAVRAAAAAQQAQALEQYRRAQAEELQRKATQEENERLDLQKRMTDFSLRVGHGQDRFQTALDLGLVPQSSLPSFLAAQEAAKRASEKDNRTPDQIQREDIIRLMDAARASGLAPDEKQRREKELEIAELQAGTRQRPTETEFEKNLKRILDLEGQTESSLPFIKGDSSAIRDARELELRRGKLGMPAEDKEKLRTLVARANTLRRKELKTPEEKDALVNLEAEIDSMVGITGSSKAIQTDSPKEKAIQKTLPLAKKPYFDRPKTIH